LMNCWQARRVLSSLIDLTKQRWIK
jgi:hypothetical protein